ncbi:MAG: hypothetical protein MZV65_33660 [Chromatiales bacterium]|nr:hypothetical protein [Chromatiales bacterium]
MSLDRRDFLQGLAGRRRAAGAAALRRRGARRTQTVPPEAIGHALRHHAVHRLQGLRGRLQARPTTCRPIRSAPTALYDAPLDLNGHDLERHQGLQPARRQGRSDGYAFMKAQCMHCVDPSCVSACMVHGAAQGRGDRHRQLRPGRTASAAATAQIACPFNVPQVRVRQGGRRRSCKCELCRHRVADGDYAACAEVCPTGATLFGTVPDLLPRSARAARSSPASATDLLARGASGGLDRSTPARSTSPQRLRRDGGAAARRCSTSSRVPFEKLGLPAAARSASYAAHLRRRCSTRSTAAWSLPVAVLGVLAVASAQPRSTRRRRRRRRRR